MTEGLPPGHPARPNKRTFRVWKDGTEETIYEDGTRCIKYPNGVEGHYDAQVPLLEDGPIGSWEGRVPFFVQADVNKKGRKAKPDT